MEGQSQVKVNSPIDNLIPPSPEASALGKYVSIPVGLYTGVPDITIPLYELKSGDLSLPVSFSYHASGHRVDEFAPRTGLGWVLNAGGTISRTIIGSADEYGYNGLLTNSKQMNPSNFYLGSNTDLFNRYQQVIQCADVSPDQFTFNVAGMNGKFAFNWGQEIAISSEKKVKIRPLSIPDPSAASFIPGWEIIDDNGNIYTFEAQETTKAFITGIYLCNYLTPPVTSWHLTRIRSVSGHEISFTYQPYSMEYTILASESILHREGVQDAFSTSNLQPMTIKGQYLSQINTSEGYTIRFIAGPVKRDDLPGYTSGTYPLEEIIVTSKDGSEIKHFKASYDYSLGRLTLKQVQELPAPGSTDSPIPPYSFAYTGVLPEMPKTGAVSFFGQDHWGFKNSNTKNTLLPTWSVMVNGYEKTFPGANREASITGSSAGLLTSITYPAGGKTSFEFETNDYSYVSGIPLYKDVTVSKSASSSHPGNGTPVFDFERHFTTVPFTINPNYNNADPIKVKVSVGMGYCSMPGGFGEATLAPYARILDGSGNPIRVYYNSSTPISDSLYLQPGNYFVETSTRHATCENGGWDNCYASIYWVEGIAPIRTNKLAGGARVKKITDFDGTNPANNIVRRFIYREPGADSTISSGVIGVEPEYVYTMYIHEGDEFSSFLNPVMHKCRESSSVIPAALTQGSHIGYSKVSVLYGANGEGGKTESIFSSFNEEHDELNMNFPFAPHTSYDYRRGQLKFQTDYKNENGQFIPVRTTENKYWNDADQVVGYKVGKLVTGGGPWSPDLLFRYAVDDFKLIFGRSQLKSTRITEYENGREFVKEKSFQYDPALQLLLSSSSKIQEGKEMITSYTYPFQYTTSNGILADMKARNMVAPVIEEVTKEKQADGSEKMISASFNRYTLVNDQPKLTAVLTSESTVPVTDLITSLNNAGNYDTRYYRERYNYNRYNMAGKPLQVSTPGNDTACMIYNAQGTMPVARVVNAIFDRCAFTSFEPDDQGNWNYADLPENYAAEGRTGKRSFKGNITSNSLRPGKYIISLWAKTTSGGSITVNGVTQSIGTNWKRYQWVISDPGMISIISNGTLLDELRLHPAESLMKTFTYIYGIGISSATDENHQSIFYEYDGYGRLKNIRNNEGNITNHYRYQYK
ncbi:MAG: hypothetical protein J7578_04130 [Chitinophagaceae bacterium]|nr:hypothetical protein [Chitinophagaceae bacterium]